MGGRHGSLSCGVGVGSAEWTSKTVPPRPLLCWMLLVTSAALLSLRRVLPTASGAGWEEGSFPVGEGSFQPSRCTTGKEVSCSKNFPSGCSGGQAGHWGHEGAYGEWEGRGES